MVFELGSVTQHVGPSPNQIQVELIKNFNLSKCQSYVPNHEFVNLLQYLYIMVIEMTHKKRCPEQLGHGDIHLEKLLICLQYRV